MTAAERQAIVRAAVEIAERLPPLTVEQRDRLAVLLAPSRTRKRAA